MEQNSNAQEGVQWKVSLQPPSSLERKWKSLSCVQLFATHGLHNPWNSPGQNTGVGSLSLLQGIFPTQGLNPGLLHCRRILYRLSHKGSLNLVGGGDILFIGHLDYQTVERKVCVLSFFDLPVGLTQKYSQILIRWIFMPFWWLFSIILPIKVISI